MRGGKVPHIATIVCKQLQAVKNARKREIALFFNIYFFFVYILTGLASETAAASEALQFESASMRK